MIGADWTGGDLRDADWRLPLPAAASRALARAATRGDGAPDLDPLRPVVAEVRRRLEQGPGVVVVDGMPVDVLDEVELTRLCLLLGACLGRAVSQDRSGTLVARVEDAGARLENPTQRGHKSCAALPFHVDRTDTIGLLCVRPALRGGESRVVSAAAVRRILRREAPDALAALSAPLPQDRRGEGPPGEPGWLEMPVFGADAGSDRVVSRYVPRFVLESQRLPDAPRLSDDQREALARVAGLLESPGLALRHRLEPGSLQLLDNFATWHARSAFEDGPGGRLLLRLWLATPGSPPLPPSFRALYGATAAGCVRGGVWPGGRWPPDLGRKVRALV